MPGDDRTPADTTASDGRIAVYRTNCDGEPEAYVAIWERESRDDAYAEMTAEPDGWWRVTSAAGVRGMWVRPGTAEPWREIVHRLLGRNST
ncbi:hypothetical protein GCM10022254_10210 [Actinomadura meridiana]|uniref:Uncharacterized protein n=1 Tax=Actinomadura meridiana TaxID=559626 RepID=A0ABP8BUP2_9ACTN